MTETKPKTLVIDGKEYLLDSLSKEVKDKINNLRFVDAEIMRLRNQIVVCQAARVEYVRQIQQELPPDPQH